MHMADALISPAVGGTMWAATAGLTIYSARKLKGNPDEHIVPLMGVLGAFIFAAQMINFTIPATGSSGHLGGGMILAILLGPYAAFLVMASVLTIQALFFADGGLLALGCNIFNLGFFPCFIAYPFIYKKIVGEQPTQGRILAGAMASGIIALQCPVSGLYHAQSESLLVEVLNDEGQPCKPGEVGRIVITDLHNFATPLIRYEIRDYAEVGPPCPCGRGLQTFSRIMGRRRNMVVFPNGERHWPLVGAYRFREVADIKQYQVIQHALDDIEVMLDVGVRDTVGHRSGNERIIRIVIDLQNITTLPDLHFDIFEHHRSY